MKHNIDRLQFELDKINNRIQEINALFKEGLKENELAWCQDLDRQLSPLLIRKDIIKDKLDEMTKQSIEDIKIFG